MPKQVLSVGMINCDVPLFPIPSNLDGIETIRVTPPRFCIGGDATNVAMTLAKLGLPVSLVGRVGDDAAGRQALEVLKANGVDTRDVIISEQDVTTTSYHLLREDGSHHFIYYATTVESLCAADIADKSLENVSAVYFGSALTFAKMDDGGIADLFCRAHAHGALTIMDAALAGEAGDGAVDFAKLGTAFAQTDIFFPSLIEAEYLTGESQPHEIARRFAGTGLKMLGIKLGGNGCYLTDFSKEYRFSCFHCFKVVDTVGAGDSFAGGLIAALTRGDRIEDGITFASAVSGFNIQQVGATGGVPKYQDVEDFVSRNRLQIEVSKF